MTNDDVKSTLRLVIETKAKRRIRLTPSMKAWAKILGLPLRGRGRPPKVGIETGDGPASGVRPGSGTFR